MSLGRSTNRYRCTECNPNFRNTCERANSNFGNRVCERPIVAPNELLRFDFRREAFLCLKRSRRLPGRHSKKIIAEIFASHGFRVELTGRVGGRSADILAIRTDELGVDTRYLIEAKRYRAGRKIGLDIVNQVLGSARRQNVEHAFLVTTSRFTADVEKERVRLGELRLHLRDGEAIKEWLSHYTVRSDGGVWLDPRCRFDA